MLAAAVFEHKFTDYLRKEQIALDHAVRSKLLLLDAGEWAIEALQSGIQRTISHFNAVEGLGFRGSCFVYATITGPLFTAIGPGVLLHRRAVTQVHQKHTDGKLSAVILIDSN